MKGTYILKMNLSKNAKINVGSLGKIDFKPGTYFYVGSAFGSGGFKRIKRHKNVSKGKNKNKHWHIDYLTSSSYLEIVDIDKFPKEKVECELAQKLKGEPVEKFGCSDCDCRSHLKFINSNTEDYL
ncbi:MAG: DUF123 domain-containing protein [Candidatus Magasanikbacteria bacterium]